MNVSGIKAYSMPSYNYNSQSQTAQTKPQQPAQPQTDDVAFQGIGRRIAGGAAALLAVASIALGGYKVGMVHSTSTKPMNQLGPTSSISSELLPSTVAERSLKELAGTYFSDVKTEEKDGELIFSAKYNPSLVALHNAKPVFGTLKASEEDPNEYMGRVTIEVPDEDSYLLGSNIKVASPPAGTNIKSYDFTLTLLGNDETSPLDAHSSQGFRMVYTDEEGQKRVFYTTEDGTVIAAPNDNTSTNGAKSPKPEIIIDPLASLAATILLTLIYRAAKDLADSKGKSSGGDE